jgi:hypothetical protein
VSAWPDLRKSDEIVSYQICFQWRVKRSAQLKITSSHHRLELSCGSRWSALSATDTCNIPSGFVYFLIRVQELWIFTACKPN